MILHTEWATHIHEGKRKRSHRQKRGARFVLFLLPGPSASVLPRGIIILLVIQTPGGTDAKFSPIRAVPISVRRRCPAGSSKPQPGTGGYDMTCLLTESPCPYGLEPRRSEESAKKEIVSSVVIRIEQTNSHAIASMMNDESINQ